LEEDAGYFRDRENGLMGEIKEKLLQHPLGPLLTALRMAGGAEFFHWT